MTTRRLSPRKSPRQRRAMDTRERILAAAARVFAEHGYAHGTTNRIAEEAGHSIGSLYQYFPNKDAILVELATAHAREGITAIETELRDGSLPDSLEGKLRLFVRIAVDQHRDDPALHRVLFEEAPRSAELLELLHTAEARLEGGVRVLLDVDPAVRVSDTAMAARLVVGAVESLVHRFIASGSLDELDRFENELVAMLVRYLSAEGD